MINVYTKIKMYAYIENYKLKKKHSILLGNSILFESVYSNFVLSFIMLIFLKEGNMKHIVIKKIRNIV